MIIYPRRTHGGILLRRDARFARITLSNRKWVVAKQVSFNRKLVSTATFGRAVGLMISLSIFTNCRPLGLVASSVPPLASRRVAHFIRSVRKSSTSGCETGCACTHFAESLTPFARFGNHCGSPAQQAEDILPTRLSILLSPHTVIKSLLSLASREGKVDSPTDGEWRNRVVIR